MGTNLLDLADQSIEQAGLKNGTVMIEFLRVDMKACICIAIGALVRMYHSTFSLVCQVVEALQQ